MSDDRPGGTTVHFVRSTTSVDLTREEIDKEWKKFKAKFNKKYPNDNEEQRRKDLFAGTLRETKRLNKGNLTWTAGITEFADRTKEELSALFPDPKN